MTRPAADFWGALAWLLCSLISGFACSAAVIECGDSHPPPSCESRW